MRRTARAHDASAAAAVVAAVEERERRVAERTALGGVVGLPDGETRGETAARGGGHRRFAVKRGGEGGEGRTDGGRRGCEWVYLVSNPRLRLTKRAERGARGLGGATAAAIGGGGGAQRHEHVQLPLRAPPRVRSKPH